MQNFGACIVNGFATGIGFGLAYLLFRALHLI